MASRLALALLALALLASPADANRRRHIEGVSDSYEPPAADIAISHLVTLTHQASEYTATLTVSTSSTTDFDPYIEYRYYTVGLPYLGMKLDDGMGDPYNSVWKWKTGRLFSGTYAGSYSSEMTALCPQTIGQWELAGPIKYEARFCARYVKDGVVKQTDWIYSSPIIITPSADTTAPSYISGTYTTTPFGFFGHYLAISTSNARITNAPNAQVVAVRYRILDQEGDVSSESATYNIFGVCGPGTNMAISPIFVDESPASAVARSSFIWTVELKMMDSYRNESEWTEVYTFDMRDYD